MGGRVALVCGVGCGRLPVGRGSGLAVANDLEYGMADGTDEGEWQIRGRKTKGYLFRTGEGGFGPEVGWGADSVGRAYSGKGDRTPIR